MSGKMAPIGQITGLGRIISTEHHIKYDKNLEGQFLKNFYFPMAFYSCFESHRTVVSAIPCQKQSKKGFHIDDSRMARSANQIAAGRL